MIKRERAKKSRPGMLTSLYDWCCAISQATHSTGRDSKNSKESSLTANSNTIESNCLDSTAIITSERDAVKTTGTHRFTCFAA